MGIFQAIVDFYDYKIPYYRYYVHRRILFSDETQEKDKPKESLFSNNDYENFDLIVRKSFKYFLYGGAAYSLLVSPKIHYSQKVPINQLIARGTIITAYSGLAGVIYATLVYAVANLRGEKNDAVNHMIASALTMPTFAIFAKKDRLSAALAAAVYPALVVGFFKLAGTGGLNYGKLQTKFNYKPSEMEKDLVLYRENPVSYREGVYRLK